MDWSILFGLLPTVPPNKPVTDEERTIQLRQTTEEKATLDQAVDKLSQLIALRKGQAESSAAACTHTYRQRIYAQLFRPLISIRHCGWSQTEEKTVNHCFARPIISSPYHRIRLDTCTLSSSSVWHEKRDARQSRDCRAAEEGPRFGPHTSATGSKGRFQGTAEEQDRRRRVDLGNCHCGL